MKFVLQTAKPAKNLSTRMRGEVGEHDLAEVAGTS